MIRSLDLAFPLAQDDAADLLVHASLVHVRSTLGGVDHYMLALGHGGRLLACYLVRAFRGVLIADRAIDGSPDAPDEVIEGALDRLAPRFHALWYSYRIDALDARGRHREAYRLGDAPDDPIVDADGIRYARAGVLDFDGRAAYVPETPGGLALYLPRRAAA